MKRYNNSFSVALCGFFVKLCVTTFPQRDTKGRNLQIFFPLIDFLLFTATLTAQTHSGFKNVADVIIVKEGVRKASAEMNSLSSKFIQEKHLTMMDEVLISKGRFLFKKENNIRWEYTTPIRYAIIIRGDRFVINNDGKISEFDTGSNRLFKEINNMILMAISGNFVDNPDFKASFFENDTFYLVSLKPQNERLGDILQSIDIYFDKKDFGVRKVKFVEPGDDFTLIVFTDQRVNVDIPDGQFIPGND